MLLEGGDHVFHSIDAMVVRGHKLYIHFVGANMLFDGLGTLIVHDVEGRLVVMCA